MTVNESLKYDIKHKNIPKTHSQRFLLSAKARALSLRDVLRMTDEQTMAMFRAIRWVETEGESV